MTTQPLAGSDFNNADAYEAYVGRWSRLAAKRFIDWLSVPAGAAWLDVGAGTGILTSVILEQAVPKRVVALDPSADYLGIAHQRILDSRVEFRLADATQAGAERGAFDAAVAGLVLNFVPDPQVALNSMTEAVATGGVVAAYVWDYGGRMEMMRHFWDAAAVVDPTAATMDAGPRFAICKPDNLGAAFVGAGLQSVDVAAIDIPTRFRDFDDYWLPFLGAQGSVASYLRSIDDVTRAAVREQLQRQLPIATDGTISLVARAWAAKGTKVADPA